MLLLVRLILRSIPPELQRGSPSSTAERIYHAAKLVDYCRNHLSCGMHSKMEPDRYVLRKSDKLWILLIALLALLQVGVSLFMPQGQALTVINDLVQGALLLAATAAFFPHCFPERTPAHRTRAFWILMTAGMAFWLTYQAMWNYFEVIKNQEVPNPFAGDVVLFLHLVPMIAALALLPHLAEHSRDFRIRMLDFALLFVWWLFLYVYLVIPWQTVDVNEPSYSSNFNITYLTEKLVLLLALMLATYHAQGGWRHLYAQLLGATALYASASYVANYAILHQTYYSGSMYDIPWTLSVAWIAFIGRFAKRLDLSESPLPQPLLGVWITRLGMLALFSLPWFAYFAQANANSPSSVRSFRAVVSLIVMLVMGTLVFLRQRLLGTELTRLLEESRRSIDDLRTLQAQLIQSEKLASLGQLVGGAAHEINNPLTAMLGYSDLLGVSPLPPDEEVLASRIAAQVRRTRTLVASLLTFVRQAPAQLGPVDLNSIVQTAMRLLVPQLEMQSAPMDMKLGTALPLVLADSNQLLHVCLHLAGLSSNRAHAAGPTGLRVRTGQEDETVFVEFSSTEGTSEVRFQPLQQLGAGKPPTSLSLGACSRIVLEHGGRILVSGHDGELSAFRVEIPVVRNAAQIRPAVTTSRAVASSSS